MNNKIKNVTMCLQMVVIIICSFSIPYILVQKEDARMEKEIYRMDKIDSKIDVQAENIYLVKVIHEMDEGYFNVLIGESIKKKQVLETSKNKGKVENNITKQVIEEIVEMQDKKILKDININNNDSQYTFGIIEKTYKNYLSEYFFNDISIEINDIEIKVQLEGKTQKILYIEVSKDKLENEIEKQEIMENYIKYLDLYIIGDWKMENNRLESRKAQLAVSLEEKGNKYILSVHSMNKNSNIKYYKVAE